MIREILLLIYKYDYTSVCIFCLFNQGPLGPEGDQGPSGIAGLPGLTGKIVCSLSFHFSIMLLVCHFFFHGVVDLC